MGVLLMIMVGVVSLNAVVGLALVVKYAAERRRHQHGLTDARLASVLEAWQREPSHH